MYRHLLVPIDGSDLAVSVVGNAVALARKLGARLSFFHPVLEQGGSAHAEGEAARDPERPEGARAWRQAHAREWLAKAEAAARAYGLSCESSYALGATAALAIAAAARERHCDLIFTASNANREETGTAYASQTLVELMQAGLPLLVSACGEPAPQARAIGIIRDEHRSLAAVLHAWLQALSVARRDQTLPDARLMHAIVHFVGAFSAKMHHPKEEAYLFARLRERTGTLHAEIEELERQHERDGMMVRDIKGLTDAASAPGAGPAEVQALESAVQAYASFVWEHLGREEGVILPAAQRFLVVADWEAIDAAFEANRCPRFSGDEEREYRQVFSRIVALDAG
ncbi:MAG: hemerythrin domain-containing protein [Burkholderiales bacterium]|nr:hemerythrin domain-containing protein [Burkholderiales bacterium]